MNIKSTIIASTVLAASVVSAPVFAQESQVQTILTSMVKQALSSATNEIDTQIEKSVITAGHMIELDKDLPATQVKITDITELMKAPKAAPKSEINEKVNQSQDSSDE